jgi:hypothetical protein
MSRQPSDRSRRGLLIGAGTALAAVAVVAAETPADAAGPGAVLLGRANAGGARTTGLTSTLRGAAWQVVQRGTGFAAALYARGTGLFATTSGANGWGAHARNDGTATGSGGALRGQGRRNAGLLADTTAQDVPAVVAIGGDGTGVAQVATGQSYLDGDALALRAWTGVVATDTSHVVYAPLVSAEAALHTGGGHLTLDGAGGAAVTLPTTFTAACDMTTLRVSLTPVAVAMPALYATYRQAAGGVTGSYEGFDVAGGAAGGVVAWSAWAVRAAVDLAHLQAGSVAPARTASGAAADGEPQSPPVPPVPARFSRPPVALPGR